MSEIKKSYKLIIIGAGISGIIMASCLKTQLKLEDFIILEAREEVGGTWLANKYPGASCDVESHLYSLYSNLNPNWSNNYAGQSEIHDYWINVVKANGFREKIQFSTVVKSAQFNEDTSKWELEVSKVGDSKVVVNLECDILIGGVGNLRIPKIPEVFKDFNGPIMHSAEWNTNIELENKIVGVVGSGASAVQIIPSIIDKVKELHCFQRNPPWVVLRNRSNYSPLFKFLKNWLPGFSKLIYWLLVLKDDLLIQNAFIQNSLVSKVFLYKSKQFIQSSISDPIKRELMTPKYYPGCKSTTPSDTYYKAIDNPKLTLNDGNIDRIEGTTIYSKDGKSKQVDVLILATGFQTNSPYSEIKIKNLDGEHIDKQFNTIGKLPSTNYGITHSKMPNFFQLCGPSTNLSYSSATRMIECQASYIIKLIQKMNKYNVKTVDLKEEVGQRYWLWVQEKMKLTAWSKSCGSWYKNDNGEVIANWPCTGLAYYWYTSRVNLSDYNCTCKANQNN